MNTLRVDKVEYALGLHGDEEPSRFLMGVRWVDVREVIDRWLAADHRYFKLISNDGDIYILRQDMPTDIWEMILYERRTPRESRGKQAGVDDA